MYLLWQIEYKKLQQDIMEACDAYEQRFEQRPLVVLLPESLKDQLAGLSQNGVELLISSQVARSTLWVGKEKP